MNSFVIPPTLRDSYGGDETTRAWLEALPEQATEYLDRWELTLDGPSMHGAGSLVLPVRQIDGTSAVLKLQPFNEENAEEALALRTWNPDDVVRVLKDDRSTATLLIERLHLRTLSDVPDHEEATRILAELLARLTAVPAPAVVRRLGDVAAEMLADAPTLIPKLADPVDRELAHRCAAALAEVATEPGDRLLHWDLHYDNVLAADRAPWLVIDPKPLAGDPGFEVFAALKNRWDDLVASGDLPRAIRRRFDLMTEIVGLERDRTISWTLGRILQNVLWDVEAGETRIEPVQVEIAGALLEPAA
ncbi:streptomycin 6-kinase [Kribbella amoyensis]|uniref:Streptomycin 6-kinase n=1 Tax=Kribbella amoyensis TaxID=996641 RepID=A0A561BP75_9ACTN|nr:aminoglycoside phosphotransferase family protein [Kribbella amoyensis]TWD80679.1 streptomycin 6-kinase [Kribbella amoyensis]